MFGIGGFNPVSLLATAALGPAGGILSQLAMQVFSQIGQQIIQQMGNNLNLPQSTIDLEQGSFAARYGDFEGAASNLNDAVSQFGQEAGVAPSDIGQAQRETNDAIRDLVNSMSESDDVKEARAGGRGGSWLRAMAEVLGAKLDASADEMRDLANRVTKDDPSTTTDFNVVSQEFNMLMNATTTAIKTIGEALGKAASRN